MADVEIRVSGPEGTVHVAIESDVVERQSALGVIVARDGEPTAALVQRATNMVLRAIGPEQ